MVVAALPAVMVDLEIPLTDLDTAAWIVTGYLIAYTVAMPLAGRLSDVRGRVRMFQAALVLFSIGSALVAIAPDFSWIVSARVLQAIGGGATVPSVWRWRWEPSRRRKGSGPRTRGRLG